MKIAQVAPLAESVPPTLYGGTERIVSYLTEELVRQGHDVTLFAAGNSQTSARLVAPVRRALRLETRSVDPLPYNVMLLEAVRARAATFDVIHFHVDLLPLAILRTWETPSLFTLHGRLDLPDLWACYRMFSDVPLVSISDNQRRPMPTGITWAGTVYHGLPLDSLPFSPRGKDGYLAFLGRISPEKRPDRAIEIAIKANRPLRIAAKIDRVDMDYWNTAIAPLIARHPNVTYIGEIDDAQKARFLGDAAALLFPIDWPEPFGIAMIEAMACGTPVIAFSEGSVPEVIEDGITGRIVQDIDEAVAAVNAIDAFDRTAVRRRFEQRFGAVRMASDYVEIYECLLAKKPGITPLTLVRRPAGGGSGLGR